MFFVAIAASSCPVSSFPPRRGPHRPTGPPVGRGTWRWCQAMMVIAVTPSAHLVKPHRRQRAHLGPASVFPLHSGAESDVRWACHTHLCHLPSPSARPRRQRDGLTRPQLPPPPSHPPRRQRDGLPYHRGLLLPPSQRVVDVDASAWSVWTRRHRRACPRAGHHRVVPTDGRRQGSTTTGYARVVPDGRHRWSLTTTGHARVVPLDGRRRASTTTGHARVVPLGGRQRAWTTTGYARVVLSDGRRQRRGTPASCPSTDANGRRQRRVTHVSCL